MEFKIGEIVIHISMIGPMTVLAKITIESKHSYIETMYRCRSFDGRIGDFYDYELKARDKRDG